jgi:hypothetical protein
MELLDCLLLLVVGLLGEGDLAIASFHIPGVDDESGGDGVSKGRTCVVPDRL